MADQEPTPPSSPADVARRVIPAIPHRFRFAAIAVALAATLVLIFVPQAAELLPALASDEGRATLWTLVFVLIPALADAGTVEARRRDGTIPALPDDRRD